ncbi:hypothetical protein IKS38_06640 [bacterium]|nr:hypothetical protein [bacterium]
MKNHYILFVLCFLLGLTSLAAGPQEWKKAFKDAKIEESSEVDILYFEQCQVPGKAKAKVEETNFKELKADDPKAEEVKDPFDSEAEWGSDDKLTNARENIQHYNEEIANINEQLKKLDPDADFEEVKNLKFELKANQAMLEIAQEVLAEMEGKSAEKEVSKKPEEKKEVKKEEKKEEKTAAEKPKKGPEVHFESTSKYYDIPSLASAASDCFSHARGILDVNSDDGKIHYKVYFITDPKMWKALKREGKHFSPARNADWDMKSRSVLLFASPAITNSLAASLKFAMASLAFERKMLEVNPKEEASDLVARGFAFHVSGLNSVVDINKVFYLPALKEKDLLAPSELINPTRMNDPKRLLCFSRQCAAVVDFFMKHSNFLNKYIPSLQGGNSGFRNSFQHLGLGEDWAENYDDFCNNMTTRLFFPLTEAANDAEAYSEWKQSLENDAIAQKDKEAMLQRRKETRERRHNEYKSTHTSSGKRIIYRH